MQRKLKKNTLIIVKKEIKNIIKTKISINLQLINKNKKLIKKQITFHQKIQNDAEYNMFKNDQNFYEHIESELKNFNNISKNKNMNFIKLFKQKLKNREKTQ